MTAPDGLAVVRELLDQLDTAHAAATPGVWSVYWGDHIGSGVTREAGGVRVEHDVAELRSDREDEDTTRLAADAAVIVADHNAVPQLVAALRRVAELLDRWDEDHADWCCTKGCALPAARHLTTESMQVLLGSVAADPFSLPTTPCAGACTCDTGPRIAGVREALVGALTAGSADQ